MIKAGQPFGDAGLDIFDVVVDEIMEEIVFKVLPQSFNGIQLWRCRREEKQCDIGRTLQLAGGMPAGPVQYQKQMFFRLALGQFFQKIVHK